MATSYVPMLWEDHFLRAQAYSTTPGFNGWTIKDTSASGTPTYVNSAAGAVLTLAATSEAEIVTLYQNDVLIYDIDQIQSISFDAKVSGIDAATTLCFGLASAQNDTADSVTANAWFRMEGSASTSNVVVETDDGTNDNDDKATGTTLASTMKRFTIAFGESGGAANTKDVRFYIDNQRVASTTTFDMSNYTSGLQPFVQLQKASGTGTPAVTIRRVQVVYNHTIS